MSSKQKKSKNLIFENNLIFQVYDILVVNEDYKGDEQGSISLRRGDIVEVINTGASQTENGVSK